MQRNQILEQLAFYLNELHNYYLKTQNINILNNLIKHYMTLVRYVNENTINNNEIKIIFDKIETLLNKTKNELI